VSTSKKTTTKAPAKKAPAKKVVSKKVAPKKQAEFSEPTYAMTREVKEWIERANSTIQHLRGKVERLERENKELKAYQKFAEHRILRSEHES
jgi:predicted RNase H-like nuclease (RuvC/YqgF family)